MRFADAVHDALQIQGTTQSIDAVQDATIAALAGIDPTADIKKTGYFNHSWAPDFIVRWDGKDAREVFLRFNVTSNVFVEELDLLAAPERMFLGLRDEKRENGKPAPASNALVTDAPAVDELRRGADASPEVRLATREVIRGGRGYLDGTGATHLVDSARLATSAVRSRSASPQFHEWLQNVENYLEDDAASRFETTLHAVWLTSGGDPALFPGRRRAAGGKREQRELLDAALTLIGEQYGAYDLSSLSNYVGFDDLSRALRDRRLVDRREAITGLTLGGEANWRARYAYCPPFESDTLSGRFEWTVSDLGLEINLISRRAAFSDDKRRFKEKPQTFLPEVSRWRDRLVRPDVIGVGLITYEENVAVTLRETTSRTIAESLDYLLRGGEEPLWREPRLTELTIRLPDLSATVHMDFRTSKVEASEPIPLRNFVMVVADFAAGLNPAELNELTSALTPA